MTKSSLIQREKKRNFLYRKFFFKIKKYKNIIKNKNISKTYIDSIKLKFQKIPRNANPTRIRNRCFITGRARGFFRRFGLSRHVIRDYIFKGYIPGIVKASW